MISPGDEQIVLTQEQLSSKNDGFALAKEELNAPSNGYDPEAPYAKRVTLYTGPDSQSFEQIRVVGMRRDDDADFLGGVSAAMEGVAIDKMLLERALLTERVRSALLDMVRAHSTRNIMLKQVTICDFDEGAFFTALAKLGVVDVRIILHSDCLADPSPGVFLGKGIEEWKQQAAQWSESYDFALYEPEEGFKMLIWATKSSFEFKQ